MLYKRFFYFFFYRFQEGLKQSKVPEDKSEEESVSDILPLEIKHKDEESGKKISPHRWEQMKSLIENTNVLPNTLFSFSGAWRRCLFVSDAFVLDCHGANDFFWLS